MSKLDFGQSKVWWCFGALLILLSAAVYHYSSSNAQTDTQQLNALRKTTVAVASNFSSTAATLLEAFDPERVHQFDLISGSTGKHTAQINHGQPIDLLLAADTHRPAFLVEQGKVWQGHRAIYAIGKLFMSSKMQARMQLVGNSKAFWESSSIPKDALPQAWGGTLTLDDLQTTLQSRLRARYELAETFTLS